MSTHQRERVEILICPPSARPKMDLKELWPARFLLWNLVRRNVLTAYVDHRYGVVWTIFKPVLFVLVAIFIKNASQANLLEGVAYVPFVYSGLALWWFFVDATTGAARSIYKDRGLITKVYYPRLVTPIAPVLAVSVDLLIRLSILPLVMLYYAYKPDWRLALLPLILANVMFFSLGVGLLVASFSTRYRDIEKILAYVLYMGLFLSPVLFSSDMIPEQHRSLYFILNPMAAPLENFRAVLFAHSPIHWGEWGISFAISMVVLLAGLISFSRTQVYLADRVL